MSGWIFTIIGWLFSHTAATQLFKHLIKVIFVHFKFTKIRSSFLKSNKC